MELAAVILVAALCISSMVLLMVWLSLFRLWRRTLDWARGVEALSSHSWFWPALGLALGSVVTALVGQDRAKPELYSGPELAQERLTTAYNLLLMAVNSLSPTDRRPDADRIVSLRKRYASEVRSLLYTQSHLLSSRVLETAANIDMLLSDAKHTETAVRQMAVLQRRVQEDHRYLRSLVLTRSSK